MLPGLAGIPGLIGASAAGAPLVKLGNINAPAGNINASANFQVGGAYQASQSFTANYITITGNLSSGSSVNFRLCIYNATSETVWSGSLLGETAVQNGLGIAEVKKVALLSPASIVSGNWYAITIQTETTMGTGHGGGGGSADRFFADTYSDGALATAGASGANSGNSRCIYISSS